MEQGLPLSPGEWVMVFCFAGAAMAIAAVSGIALLVWLGGSLRDPRE